MAGKQQLLLVTLSSAQPISQQAGFTDDTGDAIATQYGGSWGFSNKANNGWLYCGMSLEECQSACCEMGCAELSVTSNNCCFPAMSVCEGSRRVNDDKWYLIAEPSTSTSPPSTPPTPPSSSCTFEAAGDDDHWCGLSHAGQAGFTDDTGDAIATQYGGSWGLSNKANNGWLYCGMSLEECQSACCEMGCAELSVTSNNCCEMGCAELSVTSN